MDSHAALGYRRASASGRETVAAGRARSKVRPLFPGGNRTVNVYVCRFHLEMANVACTVAISTWNRQTSRARLPFLPGKRTRASARSPFPTGKRKRCDEVCYFCLEFRHVHAARCQSNLEFPNFRSVQPPILGKRRRNLHLLSDPLLSVVFKGFETTFSIPWRPHSAHLPPFQGFAELD